MWAWTSYGRDRGANRVDWDGVAGDPLVASWAVTTLTAPPAHTWASRIATHAHPETTVATAAITTRAPTSAELAALTAAGVTIDDPIVVVADYGPLPPGQYRYDIQHAPPGAGPVTVVSGQIDAFPEITPQDTP